MAFLALEAISFFIGSSMAIKSFFNLVIKILFILEFAACSNKFTNIFFCSLWGVKNSSQASLRALRTCLLIFFSSVFNSSSVEILFSSIHSLYRLLQSFSFSHCNRSSLLYRSWEPEVECPCGCVSSVI